MPIAISPRNNEILLLQMDGNLTIEEAKKAIEMVKEAGKEIHKAQVRAVKEGYEKILEKYGLI
ncbi:MAG: hypothetical protein QXL16_01700, partial [Candidatus Micrarchaeaceae archaeon]